MSDVEALRAAIATAIDALTEIAELPRSGI